MQKRFSHTRLTSIPALVRIKPGALDRTGLYVQRQGFTRTACFFSERFPSEVTQRLRQSLARYGVQMLLEKEVSDVEFKHIVHHYVDELPVSVDLVIGLGGGKALDVAKYTAHLANLPFFSIPASLSHDGFASPQASLLVAGRRRTFPASMPFGVIVDTALCLEAPEILWLSGVGDLLAKITAVADWKLAFHTQGTPVDDFAVVLAEASVPPFLSHPVRDSEGTRQLATALLLSGMAMAVAGSSRPASGSEHLISHALDKLSQRPRLHGLQVGTATYVVSLLQKNRAETIAQALDKVGFWRVIRQDPFDFHEWLAACRLAPSLKSDYFTILSARNCLPEIEAALREDPYLAGCFVGIPQTSSGSHHAAENLQPGGGNGQIGP